MRRETIVVAQPYLFLVFWVGLKPGYLSAYWSSFVSR